MKEILCYVFSLANEMTDEFFQSVTQAYSEKENPSSSQFIFLAS